MDILRFWTAHMRLHIRLPLTEILYISLFFRDIVYTSVGMSGYWSWTCCRQSIVVERFVSERFVVEPDVAGHRV